MYCTVPGVQQLKVIIRKHLVHMTCWWITVPGVPLDNWIAPEDKDPKEENENLENWMGNFAGFKQFYQFTANCYSGRF